MFREDLYRLNGCRSLPPLRTSGDPVARSPLHEGHAGGVTRKGFAGSVAVFQQYDWREYSGTELNRALMIMAPARYRGSPSRPRYSASGWVSVSSSAESIFTIV